MSNFGINDGHTLNGPGSGAVGIINESEHTRLVGEAIRKKLNERGHNAINCTIDKANSTLDSLSFIVNQANRQDLDWFVAIHFNAGGGRGVEVYTYKGKQFTDALEVCSNISALGFVNRGVKDGTGLYVVGKTVSRAMLIECCFVDTEDANTYLSLGYEAIAEAIVNALVDAASIAPPLKPIPVPPPSQSIYAELQIALNNTERRDEDGNTLKIDGIAGPKTLSACPLIVSRSIGEVERVLQKLLIINNFNCGDKGADGDFWDKSASAARRYQAMNNLDVDGKVGQNTWRKLLEL